MVDGWLKDLEYGIIDSIESNQDRFTQLEYRLPMVEERYKAGRKTKSDKAGISR